MLGVAQHRRSFAPFADPVIFLFIGSFSWPKGWSSTASIAPGLSAPLSSSWVGSSGMRLVVAYASVTAFLSMWMSNTATTAMMFPLGLAILSELDASERPIAHSNDTRWRMML